jgi:hypothetical protein
LAATLLKVELQLVPTVDASDDRDGEERSDQPVFDTCRAGLVGEKSVAPASFRRSIKSD